MMLLLSIALKGALILALASGAIALLRAAPAAARHGVWVAAFVALLALPLLATLGPAWELDVLPKEMTSEATVLTLAPISPSTPVGVPSGLTVLLAPEGSGATVVAPPAPPAPPAPLAHEVTSHASVVSTSVRPSPAALAFGIWGAGAALVLLGWGITLFAAWLFVRRATPEADENWQVAFEHARLLTGIERPVRLLRSDALDVPVAWGLGSPAVVLPADADSWDEDRREAVLLHELAHIRRRDARTQLLAQLAVALHWFDPLAWWAYRCFLVEREHACDDAVLRGGAKPSAYAGHLVEIARGIRRERLALAGLSPMARKSCLEGRVLSILDERRRSAMTRVGSALLAAGAVALVLPLAACQLTEAAAEPDVYHASRPMERIHVTAERDDAEDMAEDLEWMAEDIADMELSLAELALDTIPDAETILGPALKAALSSVDELRQRGFALSDEDWREIENEIAEAFEEAREDYDEAIAEAMEEVNEEDWREDVRDALRDAERSRAEALAEAALRQSRHFDDSEDAQRERLRTAERAREAAQRAAERQSERIREQSRREAERAREKAQREAERARERAQRDADRARDHVRQDVQQSVQQSVQRSVQRQRPLAVAWAQPGMRVEPPSGPSSSYSYSISTTDGRVTAITTNGPGAWTESLSGWREGASAIEHAIESTTDSDHLAHLSKAVSGMAVALEGIGESANDWAQSSTERRIVREALQDARSELDDLQSSLADAHEDCDD